MTLIEAVRPYKIILASKSPRRIQFLKDLEIPFEIASIDVKEIYDFSLKKEEITNYLCKLKADAYEFRQDNEIIITCDTIVWANDKALGKPNNYEEAFEMLQSLSGKTHEVVSSVCLKSTSKEMVFHDITRVTFADLSTEDIHHYITTYQPYDKAGAYGIQEWIGIIGIKKIEGSYTNVVGMPMEKLFNALKSF